MIHVPALRAQHIPSFVGATLAGRLCAYNGRHKDIRQCTAHLSTLAAHEEPARHWRVPRSRRGRDLSYGGSDEGCSLAMIAPGELQRFVRL